uniref:NACHT, LRR and PYD domains-containing protein 3-like n=1 Tax=Phallusia mammillata TaxID=59560 RepID=A0A6F9DLP7_9ASCI|nr:NACHT, LRR and PYD domains-containing protein 3-like [Phallusia mammillata]
MKSNIAQMKFKLDVAKVTKIEQNYTGNSVEQRYQMLSTWVREKNLTKLKNIAKELKKLGLFAPEIYKPKSKAGCSPQDTDESSEDSNSETSSKPHEENFSPQELEMYPLKRDCKNCLAADIGSNDPVPLQVTQETDVGQFRNSNSLSFSKQIIPTERCYVTPNNLFGKTVRTCDDIKKLPNTSFDECRQNVAGLTGMPGIGKTTFCKSVFKDWSVTFPDSFVFYISSRDLNFENKKKYNVLKFLLASTNCDYTHNLERDKFILKKVEESRDTLIVIDGLDEAKHKGNFSEYPSAVKLFDEKESAYNILMNLLNGRLLPNAKKLIASRPFAFQHFHPECNPLFMAHVLGLRPESQILLCKEVCETD